MVTEYLLLMTFGLALVFVLLLIQSAIKQRLALIKFKKQFPNTPFFPAEDTQWFGNNFCALMTGKNIKLIWKRHLELGDVIAGAFHESLIVSSVDLDLIKQVCFDNASINVNRFPLKTPLKEFETDSIMLSEDDQWKKIRKSFAPALRPHRFKTHNVVQELETVVDNTLEAIDRVLNEQEKCEIKINDIIHRYSLSVVLSCFYKQYNLVNFDLSQKDYWTEMIDNGLATLRTPIASLALAIPQLRHLIGFFDYYFNPAGKWRSLLSGFIKRQTRLGFEARKELDEIERNQKTTESKSIDPDDFVLKDGTRFRRGIADYIVDQFRSGKLNQKEYFNSMMFLLNAADKTSGDTIMFILYQIAINPGIQEKLRASIRKDGMNSQYLAWVLKEALRLNPPANAGASRTSSREVKLKTGDTLPAGSLLITPLFVLHRLPKYWGSDAEEFKPERWAHEKEFHPAQYMPFGAGLRICLGKDFAEFEMTMLLCALIDRYEFSCDKIKEDLYDIDAPLMIFLIHASPFVLNISRLKNKE